MHVSRPLPSAAPAAGPASGLGWGLLGVTAFSLTVPLTSIAVEGLSPVLVGVGRAVVAALLAAVALAATRQRPPTARQAVRLLVLVGGIVLGFPVLTSLALTTAPAGHGAVVIGLLPAATAVLASLRTGERPPRRFWVLSGAGAVAAVGFAALSGGTGGAGVGLHPSDLMLLAAVVVGAAGYAEGGVLARELGAWQTVSWALVLALPLTLPTTVVAALVDPPHATTTQWASFAYLAAVSMYLGFFAWYRGLAVGPMAQVSQVQLVQPVITLVWVALLLGELPDALTVGGGLVVIGCAAGAVRSRLSAPRVVRQAPAPAAPAAGSPASSRRTGRPRR